MSPATWAVLGAVSGEGVGVAPWQGGLAPGGRLAVELGPASPRRVDLRGRAVVSGWSHPDLQRAGAVGLEVVARPTGGRVAAEAALGGGAQLARPARPRFEDARGGGPAPATDLDAVVTLGLGGDVRAAPRAWVWTRWDVVAELPFGLLGNPVLPHRVLHLGVRVALGATP